MADPACPDHADGSRLWCDECHGRVRARLAEVEARLVEASVLTVDFSWRNELLAIVRGEGDRTAVCPRCNVLIDSDDRCPNCDRPTVLP